MTADQLQEALERIARIRAEAADDIERSDGSDELELLRVRYTGRKSALTDVMQVMPRLETDGRKQLGADVNRAKTEIERALSIRGQQLHRVELDAQLEAERVDVTLPGTPFPHGYTHPLLESVRQLLGILEQMGFATFEGYEVEWERYNFDMLNVPADHPARDVQDTFWITRDMLLRTQTSPGQIRIMQATEPPLRVAVPGWCYRNEAEDASHGDRFYQIEGIAVDTDITLADLKGTLTEVARRFFGPDRRVRFRPSFFPFTEPSAELDIECGICHGSGCRSCGGEGWLELGGSGMVHPRVLEAGGFDPERVSGFAFGIGPDRYTMMKFGIPDLRLFREDDVRFLRQFS
jgi:phenylalanyl-tRNA synthetase alpha chain